MPRSEVRVERKNVRIPKRLMDEVDWIVGNSGLYLNRQQFIESAIREKVERLRVLDAGSLLHLDKGSGLSGVSSVDYAGIKEAFLVHTVTNLVNGKAMPSHHSDIVQFEERVRSYLVKMAEIGGKSLAKRELDELTESILKYHKGMLAGLKTLELVT